MKTGRGRNPGWAKVGRKAASYMVVMTALAAQADYQAGLDAYSVGDYGAAMKEWQAEAARPASEVNPAIYAETHYAIAMLYWRGQGVPADYRAAEQWLVKAADLGHAGAMAKLGFLYTDGLAVGKDYAWAFQWFERAAEAGNVDGLYNIGVFYFYGWGVGRDLNMAAQYLARASALGDAPAEEALQQVMAQMEAERDVNVGGRLAADTGGDEGDGRAQGALLQQAGPDEDEDAGGRLAADTGGDEGDGREQGSLLQGATEANADEPEPLVRGEDWIRAQDPEHYTIQVMALSDRAVLEGLLEGREALAPFAIYVVQKDTNPLHVLVQGSYPDVESARAARDAFPRRLQRPDKLWIRRFTMVQRLLE